MSASTFLAFYGIRFEVHQDEIEGLEDRSDSRLVAARRNGLNYYWGNFGSPGERWLLFIGASLGLFGADNESETQFENQVIEKLLSEARAKLRQAGFNQTPRLFLQWQPDA